MTYSRPILVDLYCGAGGAAKGYADAGFEVIGVDIEPQPDYPYAFVQMDVLDFLAVMALGGTVEWIGIGIIAAFHSSPPCQKHTALTKGNNGRYSGDVPRYEHEDFIERTRDFLDWFGLPYVIENVQGSPIRRDLVLCGEMFGLGVLRHRYFELGGWKMEQPTHYKHRGRVAGWRHGVHYDGPYVAVYGDGGGKGSISEWQEAMGIFWTSSKHSLAEAIPPAYTLLVGTELHRHLAR